jgi:hypothetical protein
MVYVTTALLNRQVWRKAQRSLGEIAKTTNMREVFTANSGGITTIGGNRISNEIVCIKVCNPEYGWPVWPSGNHLITLVLSTEIMLACLVYLKCVNRKDYTSAVI